MSRGAIVFGAMVVATEGSGVAAAHPQGSLVGLLIGLVLLALNGVFVAAEISLLAVSRPRVEQLADEGNRRAVRAAAALRELSVTFSGAQLGITMASLGLGAIAEPALAGYFESWLVAAGAPEGLVVPVGFTAALGLVVLLHMVVGEMAPKNLALSRPEQVSLALARPYGWFVSLLRPLILLLNAFGNVIVRMFGIEPVDERGLVHTPEELILALREAGRTGRLEEGEERVFTAALALRDIDAEAAMTPRVDLIAVADDDDPEVVLEASGRSGFTRFPVTHGDIDHIVGFIHVKDVLVRDPEELVGVRVRDLMRPIPAIPETRDLEKLLVDLRTDRSAAVLVVDEFGGTAGLLTLEDILEELVGEIEDEFDPDAAVVRQRNTRSVVVDGMLRRDELARLTGLRLPDGETETVSGHLTEMLGRLLERGDQIEVGGWRLIVRTIDGRRAGKVEVIAPKAPPPDET
jgi:CBS domain containing-hemolysin-like protein